MHFFIYFSTFLTKNLQIRYFFCIFVADYCTYARKLWQKDPLNPATKRKTNS